MKIQILLPLSLVFWSIAGAQTRKIAFESHSGNMENFRLAMENHLFDTEESDFGLPPAKEVKTYKLDSVIYVSPEASILVTTEYTRLATEPADSARVTGFVKDTVFNSPLFSQKHSLDSIRSVLKKEGHYLNAASLGKVVFLGYDNRRPMKPTLKPSNNFVPPVIVHFDKPDNPSPIDAEMFWMLATVFFLALAGGWLSWRFYQPRLR